MKIPLFCAAACHRHHHHCQLIPIRLRIKSFPHLRHLSHIISSSLSRSFIANEEKKKKEKLNFILFSLLIKLKNYFVVILVWLWWFIIDILFMKIYWILIRVYRWCTRASSRSRSSWVSHNSIPCARLSKAGSRWWWVSWRVGRERVVMVAAREELHCSVCCEFLERGWREI